ncbi:hypothetical protein BGX30_013444 [Mortierella sp. GBA39]|nr:hypothetical protein BGX30_013444 [Mortierella sp. GBA39]
MARAIFGLRIWLAFVCLVNLVIVSIYYGWVIGTMSNARQDRLDKPRYTYNWSDYGVIAFSVILFISYIYSIVGKKHLFHHRFERAFLMLFPALFLLGIMFRAIHAQIESAKMTNENLTGDYFMNNDSPPHVLTAGAGLAGLFLGILLEKAGIPFDIYECAAETKPHNIHGADLRQFVFNRHLKSIQQKQLVKDTAYRPQGHFLSLVPKCGTMDIIPLALFKRLQKALSV